MTNATNAKREVQAWIVRTGRTQAGLAAELGMSVGSLSMVLNGRQKCPLELAIQLSQMSGIPVELFAQFRQPADSVAA